LPREEASAQCSVKYPDIGCFGNIRCLFAGLALFVQGEFHRTRCSPDIGCLADIRCLTVMNPVGENKPKMMFPRFQRCRGDRRSPLQIFFRHRMFQKHPMSFCRASTVCSRRISPNKGFPRHRMSARHPMSNRDEFCWGHQIGFAIIKLVGANNYSPLHKFIVVVLG